MKKLVTLLSFLSVSAIGYAQQYSPKAVEEKKIDGYFRFENEFGFDKRVEMANDTLFPLSLLISGCDSVIAVYTVNGPNGGFVCGTNGLGDKEKAQLFDLSGTADLHAILVMFGGMQNQSNSALTAKVYSSNAGAPQTLLGTSSPTLLSDVDTSGGFTLFSFTNPVALTDDFFAAFDVTACYASGDSVGSFSTIQGCFTNVQRAWEKRADESWMPFNDGTNQTWGLNIDMLVFPVIEITSNTAVEQDAYIANRGLKLFGNFPNPASSFTMVKFEIDQPSEVSFDVYDLRGSRIKSENLGILDKGSHYRMLDVGTLTSGTYFYCVNTEKSSLFSVLTVSR